MRAKQDVSDSQLYIALREIQKTLTAINSEHDLNELLPMITQQAALVFEASATSLMLWNEVEENLVIVASHGLSDEYVREQSIPKERVKTFVASQGGLRGLTIQDLRLEPFEPFGRIDLLESERLLSVLAVPLTASSKLIGVLNIYSKDEPRLFSAGEMELAEIFANQAAIALQNARLRQREIRNLEVTSDAFGSTLDLGVLLPLITHKASEVFDAPAISLMLWDEVKERLIIEASCGLSDEYIRRQRIPQERINAFANAHGGFKPVVISDANLGRLGEPDLYRQEHIHTVLSTPLVVSNQLAGVLNIYSKEQLRDFTPDETELAAIFANQAAVAIENARLYEEVARSANGLRRLYDTSLDITSQLEIPRLLDAITCRARDLLNANSGIFYLYDANLNELVPSVPINRQRTAPPHLRPGEGVVGRVFQTGEPLSVEDYHEWEGRGYYERVMGVPVRHGDKILGVISVNRLLDDLPFNEQDEELLLLFANQAAIAIENARLHKIAIDNARLEGELLAARGVQASLIPRCEPQIPGWDFAALWKPAHEVSGDFYDFVQIATAHESSLQGIVIADVCGKGMPAALFMAHARSTIRASAAALSPARCVARANHVICADAADGMFVTLFYAVLDPAKNALTYVNAGHNPPLLYRARERHLSELKRTGMVLGIQDAFPFKQRRIQLYPGDFVLLYTDGVTEATDALERDFGVERLRRVILENCSAPAAEIVDAVDKAVGDFVGSAVQFDDITVVAIKRI